jgi:DNA modification methylase
LGSGTQLIASDKLGRVCYALEREPQYVDVAVMRWEAFTGEKAVREEIKDSHDANSQAITMAR